jgi:membrane-bound serine protease (ClpP class)
MDLLTLFLIFVAGFTFIFIEVFIPGGIVGSVGIVCLLAGVVFSFKEFGAGIGFLSLLGSLITTVLVLVIAFNIISRTGLSKKVFLQPASSDFVRDPMKVLEPLVGNEGIAMTTLRPAGAIQIGEERYDATTSGGFIESGQKVLVVAAEMNHLIVEKV